MCSKINRPKIIERSISGKILLVACMVTLGLLSCQKESILPLEIQNTQPITTSVPSQIHISTARLELLQCNANSIALRVDWAALPGNSADTKDYTVEANMAGSQFADWVEIGTFETTSAEFTTQEFNRQIRKLFVTGFAEDIIIRVKYNKFKSAAFYSTGALIQVTTYQPVINYDETFSFRIPGNFQNWKPELAPKIISTTGNGEYEGYINFTNAHSQFLMLKNSTIWNELKTYYYIGANKFGFSGSTFSVLEGAGIYKFNASTETNTWSCQKINSWSVHGTAITSDGCTDVEMNFNESNKRWEVTGNFNKGSFIFRANKSNAIVFGHNTTSEPGVPDYNGSKIDITRPGNYTITLSLLTAGNYSYSLVKK